VRPDHFTGTGDGDGTHGGYAVRTAPGVRSARRNNHLVNCTVGCFTKASLVRIRTGFQARGQRFFDENFEDRVNKGGLQSVGRRRRHPGDHCSRGFAVERREFMTRRRPLTALFRTRSALRRASRLHAAYPRRQDGVTSSAEKPPHCRQQAGRSRRWLRCRPQPWQQPWPPPWPWPRRWRSAFRN